MTCQDCAAWHADHTSGLYSASCDDCTARALAQSPAAWRATHAQTATDLQDAILAAFGDGERYLAGRAKVWDWINRIKAAKDTPK